MKIRIYKNCLLQIVLEELKRPWEPHCFHCSADCPCAAISRSVPFTTCWWDNGRQMRDLGSDAYARWCSVYWSAGFTFVSLTDWKSWKKVLKHEIFVTVICGVPKKSFFTVIITKKMMELLWTLKTRSCLSYWSPHLQKPTLVFGRVSVWQLNSMLFYHRLQELCLLVVHMINKCSREHFPMYQCASIRGGREKEAPVTSLNNFGKCTLSTEDNTKYTWFPFFKS